MLIFVLNPLLSVIGRLTVFVNVKSFFLHPLVHTQAYGCIHRLEQYEGDDGAESYSGCQSP